MVKLEKKLQRLTNVRADGGELIVVLEPPCYVTVRVKGFRNRSKTISVGGLYRLLVLQGGRLS